MGAAISTPSATIAINGTLSAAIYIGHGRLASLQTDATWTAAKISFQGSYDGTTYQDVYDETGSEVNLGATTAIAASKSVTIGPLAALGHALEGFSWLKLRSGLAAATTTQTAATTIKCLVRKFPTFGME